MAIAFQQAAENSAAAASVTATYGSTPTSGHFLIAVVRSNNAGAHTDPTGLWTKVTGGEIATGNRHTSVWWKVAGASEPTAVQFNCASATVSDLCLLAYSGVASASPVDQVSATENGSNVTSHTVGPVTTTVAETLLIAALGLSTASGGSVAFNNSFTIRSVIPAGNNSRLHAAGRIVSSTGTYSTDASWTTARMPAGILVAFKGAGAATTNGTAAGGGTSAGTATGVRKVLGTATGTGTSTGTASGTRSVLATASGGGTSTGTATGTRTVLATAAGAGTSTGTASGTRTVIATASGTGSSSGTASGSTSGSGAASGGGTSSGVATGVRTVLGVATGGGTSSGWATDVGRRDITVTWGRPTRTQRTLHPTRTQRFGAPTH